MWEATPYSFEAHVAIDCRHFDHSVAQQLDRSEPRAEQPQQVTYDGVEYRLGVPHRAADRSENFRRGGLVFQRFRQIVGTLAQLVEQPRVLDCDHGLRGEVLDQLDLLFVEWTNFLAVNRNRARQF